MSRVIGLASCAFFSCVSLAVAHPGHGNTDGQPLAHYFLEPQHAATTALISVLTISSLLVWRGQRRKAAAFTDRAA